MPCEARDSESSPSNPATDTVQVERCPQSEGGEVQAVEERHMLDTQLPTAEQGGVPHIAGTGDQRSDTDHTGGTLQQVTQKLLPCVADELLLKRGAERASVEDGMQPACGLQSGVHEREDDDLRRSCERKLAVAAFLKEHGFGSVSAGKRGMLKTTYPLHVAAKKGYPHVVGMLLDEGADPAQKNSSGKTAAQVAQEEDKQGSHAGVLRVLHVLRTAPGVPYRGGA